MGVRLAATSALELTMPVYEFRCQSCGARFAALVGMTAEPDDERCPKCGGADVGRLVSRFARFRSEDDRIDEMDDRLEAMGEPDSPAEARRVVRELGKAMDEDMADEMEEMFDEDMSGEGVGDGD